MQISYRFIQSLQNAITPVFNQLLAIGDKPLDIFAKLQGLLSIRQLRQVNISAVSGGASTTTDINISQLTVPGDRLVAGDTFAIRSHGQLTKPLSGGTTINFWIKVGATKVLTLTFTPTAAITNLPYFIEGLLTVRNIGSTAVLVIDGFANQATSATANTTIRGNGGTITVDTTVSQVITIGFNFSNSNASNSLTADSGEIIQK